MLFELTELALLSSVPDRSAVADSSSTLSLLAEHRVRAVRGATSVTVAFAAVPATPRLPAPSFHVAAGFSVQHTRGPDSTGAQGACLGSNAP